MHQGANILPASNLQTGGGKNISGGGSMRPYEHMGKNTKNNITELVASNLSACKPGLKFTTGLIAMLHIVKVWRPRWSSFDRFFWEAPVPGHSLCGEGGYLHGNQLTQCQSNNFVLRWINGREGRGRESFRLNHRQAFTTAEIHQYAKVSKQITADLSEEKLKWNLLDFCKISFIFDWGYKTQSYNSYGVSVGAWVFILELCEHSSIFYLKNWT